MAQELKPIFIATSFTKGCRACAQRLADFLSLFVGVRCVVGEHLGGDKVGEGVKATIESSSFVVVMIHRGPKKGSAAGREARPWLIQEMTWAEARSKPCLLLVEEGVRFAGGLLGDVEVVRFRGDNFAEAFPRVLLQVQAILKKQGLTIGVKEHDPIQIYIPKRLTAGVDEFSNALYEKALSLTDRGLCEEALEYARKLTTMYPDFWPGWLNLGALLVMTWDLDGGDAVFAKILKEFSGKKDARAAASHNRGWVAALKSLPNPTPKALAEQSRFYEQALAVDPSRVPTRAALVCTYALLGQGEQARALAEESAIYGEEFLKELRDEIEWRGPLRTRIMAQLPTLVQNLLYPIRRSRVG